MKPNYLAVICLTLATSLAGCNIVKTEIPEPTPTLSHTPFSRNFMGGNPGIFVTFKGNTQRYQPGDEATFEVRVIGLGEETQEGRYCIVLMDQQSVMASTRQEFILDSTPIEKIELSEKEFTEVPVQLPDDLEPGTYSLVFIIPNWFTSTDLIYVGNADIEDSSIGLAGLSASLDQSWVDSICPTEH
jgi:hypothetical protein